MNGKSALRLDLTHSANAPTHAAVEIVERLAKAGFVALFAGGCVRDWLMGRPPADIDIATSATPADILRVFPRAKAVGEAFGVMLVRRHGHEFEVATFRSDAEYNDGRRPDAVTLHDSPERDAARRDFTINGMFFDPLADRLLDFVGGAADIHARLIRAIGHPTERFSEDHLRLLRAIRFAARLGYRIDDATWTAMNALAPKLARIAPERIHAELTTILLGPRPDWAFDAMQQSGLLGVVMPEVSALDGVPHPPAFHREGDVFTHTLRMLAQMRADTEAIGALPPPPTDPSAPAEPEIRREPVELLGALPTTLALAWAVLLHDIGKALTLRWDDRPRFDGHAAVGAEQAESIARRLRFSNDLRERVVALVADHMKFIEIQRMRLSTLKKFLRRPFIAEHLALHRLDCLGSVGRLDNLAFAIEKLTEFGATTDVLRPLPLLTGTDLKQFGYTPGPIFKEILDALENLQLDGQLLDRESAIRWLRDQFPLTSS